VVEGEAGVGKGRLGAVRPLVPELTSWLPPAPDPLDDRIAQRHRMFRGLVES
jgi:hypothetical protein